jgi:hypothetical protein
VSDISHRSFGGPHPQDAEGSLRMEAGRSFPTPGEILGQIARVIAVCLGLGLLARVVVAIIGMQ